MFNFSDKENEAAVNAYGRIYLTNLPENTEEYIGDGNTKLKFRQKEIKTIIIKKINLQEFLYE